MKESNLLNSNQSSFTPNDPCKSQLLSVVCVIYSSFHCHLSFEVTGKFLDITKAFDRVSYEGLFCKIIYWNLRCGYKN